MSDRPFPDRDNDRRVVPWLLFGLVVLFGGLYVAGYLVTGDKVPRGTTVAGIAVGGQQPDAAAEHLAASLRRPAAEPIVVTAAGQRAEIVPARAGLVVDPEASVAQAGGGRSWSLARMWDYFTGGDDYDAVVRTDRAKLDAAVAAFAAKVDKPAKDGRITFGRGEAVPHDPQTGAALDRAAAARAIREAFLTTDRSVALRVKEVAPQVSRQDVSAAMDAFANPATSGPVVIELGGENIVLHPDDYSAALSMRVEDGRLVPALDHAALLKALEPAMKHFARAPRDAAVRLVDGRPRVIPAKKGLTFEPKQITGSFLGLVVQHGKKRTMAVKSVVARPEFTTAQARRLRITEPVSEFTTHYPHADYRNTNLGRAAHLVNGTVLKPGETFSLNRTVGERTKENGFTEGFIISDGVFKEDLGGGVSQVATTTFNAAFFAGLRDVEHKPHSFYIDRYPVGREATVAWPSVDLKFQNDTPYGVLVQAWIDPSTPSRQGSMNVRMWSTKYWDVKAGVSDRYAFTQPKTRHLKGDGCVPNTGYGGFDIDVYRYFYRHGSSTLDHKETMHTRYTPSDTVVCS